MSAGTGNTAAPFTVESIALESMVHHAYALEASTSLEVAMQRFSVRKVDFLAVVRSERVVGLCARSQIAMVMGTRFGFALYSQSTVGQTMVPRPLIVATDTPVRAVLDRALARSGDDFTEDVILVDDAGRLLGLLRADTLAQLQTRLVAEQMDALVDQRERLRRQNLELFQTNHALRQSQGLYLGLFGSHALGVALLDPEGAIYEHNQRFKALLGLAAERDGLFCLGDWIADEERAAFFAALDSLDRRLNDSVTREFTLNLPDRGTRIIRFSMGWIKETGQICACLDDVTEPRALEKKLVQQEKQTLLDTLAGGIAHELNNKLTPVRGFAELLGAGSDGETRLYAGYISRSVLEASAIISQLLQLAKPAVNTPPHRVDVCAVVREAAALLRFQLREANCALELLVPSGPICIRGDTGQLKQVVFNLVLNAIQALAELPAARITVSVRVELEEVVVVVDDNGPGIAPEHLGRIFDPFFTTKRSDRGTGLGLSICSSIVRQFGGDIRVQSLPGAGATFTVRLPLLPESITEAGGTQSPGRATGEPKPSGGRILVVDDEEVVRHVVQESLRAHFDCRVDQAANGAEGLKRIAGQDEPYRLILSDIRMPEMSGVDLYQRLLNSQPEDARRLIFLSGFPGDAELEARVSALGVPVIAKPFAIARLIEASAPFLRQPR